MTNGVVQRQEWDRGWCVRRVHTGAGGARCGCGSCGRKRNQKMKPSPQQVTLIAAQHMPAAHISHDKSIRRQSRRRKHSPLSLPGQTAQRTRAVLRQQTTSRNTLRSTTRRRQARLQPVLQDGIR